MPRAGSYSRAPGVVLSLVLGAALVLFVQARSHLVYATGDSPRLELAVRLPMAMQVIMAGGDRHLAANLSGFRVLVADVFRMQPGELELQAQLQKDISWLNPAHEDNYYIAAAILDQPPLIPAAQYVLRRAADARPTDWQPLFYLGFNRYYFGKDPVGAAQILLEAVPRIQEQRDSWTMQNLAARWLERGYNPADAARVVAGMADNAAPGAFKRYLNRRVARLQDLNRLRALAARFQERFGRPLRSLDELVSSGLIERIPADPLRVGYVLDAKGEPAFASNR